MNSTINGRPDRANTWRYYAFNLGTIAGGSNAVIVIHTVVTSSVPGTMTNWAMGSTTNQDLNLANNSDSAITFLPDTGGDGIANPADPDDDNDRFPDCNEVIANTDQLDPADFLWLRIMRTGTQTVQTLTFPTSTGRTYRIQGVTNLYTGPWVDVRTNIPGTGLPANIPETNTMNRLYYRIGVAFP